jgi:GNAT superfamily N-acetyltransferase
VTKDGRAVSLRPAFEEDASQFIQAVDGVAHEGVHFLRSRFDMDEKKERALIAGAKEREDLILLALLDGRLVGWVTLFRAKAEFRRHTAELGMGVIQGYRQIGIGTALMDYALQWAAEQGIEKVNLGFRASNRRARALYRKFGFIQEGYRVQDIKDTQDRYDDSVEMAYFVPQASLLPAEGTRGEA